jgi:hypothetical protein
MPLDEDDWHDGSRILSKYDDVAEIAAENKKKTRIKIGQSDPEPSLA